MSKQQYNIAKKIILLTFFATKVFGLWPYKIHLTKHRIEHNYFSVLYSVVLPILTLFAYTQIASDAFNTSTKSDTFSSWTLQFVVLFYSYLVMLSYVLLYLGQHLQYQKTRLAYLKCRRVADCIKEFLIDFLDIKISIISALFRTFIYDIVHFSLFLYNLALVTDKDFRLFLAVLIYLPIYAIRLYANVYYLGILIAYVLMKQLNYNLKSILSSMKDIGNIRENSKVIYVERLDQINCELEKVSKIYLELVDATKTFNSVFGLHNVLWITMQLVLLITQYFYQYVAAVQLFKYNNDVSDQYILISSALMLSSYEFLTTTNTCTSLITEVQKLINKKLV